MSTCRGTTFSTPPVICKLPFILNIIGMLSHRQNSRALRGRRWAGRGEARSRERVKFFNNEVKKNVYYDIVTCLWLQE
jgi:hypothetical protein